MNGLTEAKKIYTERGARLIHERFPEYEERIAVLQGAIEKLAAEVADVRNNASRRTVSESTMQEDSPVTMAQIMDEYLNGKEDAADGRR